MIELLVVIAIASILISLSGPMMSGLVGSNSVNKAASDLTDTLTRARAYAMANNTYVRVCFGTVAASASRPLPAFVVLCLYSSDGTLLATDESDMTSGTEWPSAGVPLVLNNLSFDTTSSLSTSAAANPAGVTTPSTTNLSFSRGVGALGLVRFKAFIQFGPSGAAQVPSIPYYPSPVRVIKVALDRPTQQTGKNPFVILLEGLSGAVEIERN